MVQVDKVILESLVMNEQKNGYFCSQSCMQSYIHYLTRKEVSQKHLSIVSYDAEKHLKSIEHKGMLKQPDEGCGSSGIIAMAKDSGLSGFIKKNASLDELAYFLLNNLPVLVNWQFIRADEKFPIDERLVGHYSIIRGFERMPGGRTELFMADPGAHMYGAHPIYYSLDYDTFNVRWFDPEPSDRGWMAVFFNERIKIPFSGRHI